MKSTGHNSGFKKCEVTWQNQVKFFNQSYVLADSFVFRNPAHLEPAKRYRQTTLEFLDKYVSL
jgi:hypothetical protein